LLWTFNVSQEEDKPIDTLAFTNAANSHPLPYTAKFTPRFDGVEEILSMEQVGRLDDTLELNGLTDFLF
jgi:hypothetical protein